MKEVHEFESLKLKIHRHNFLNLVLREINNDVEDLKRGIENEKVTIVYQFKRIYVTRVSGLFK